MYLRIVIYFSFILPKVHTELLQVPDDTESVVGQEQVVLKCQTDIINSANPVEWHYKVNKDAVFEIVYKRGMILNGFRGRLQVFPNATTGQYDLIITGVKLQDAGAYICMDRASQSKAELVVFEKYPSDAFCMSNSPSDGFLGGNDCGLEADAVTMTCDLRYRGNLTPDLVWMNGNTVIKPTITGDTNGDMKSIKSTILRTADHFQTATYTCDIRYLHTTIASNLSWSTTLNITSIKNSTNLSYVGCDQESVSCSGVDNRECFYTWLSENGTELASRSSIQLADKSDGNYICLATCSIRQTPCSYVATTFNYQCSNSNSHRMPMNMTPHMHPNKIYITVGIALAVAATAVIIIVACLFRRLLCNCREKRRLWNSRDSETREGWPNYEKDVPHTDKMTLQESFLPLTKNSEIKQIHILNENATSGKEMPEKSDMLRQG